MCIHNVSHDEVYDITIINLLVLCGVILSGPSI